MIWSKSLLRHAGQSARVRFLLAVFLVCALALIFQSCSMFGGKDVKPETVADLETNLKQARKDIDKSRKELKDIGGDVSTFEARITKIETTVINMQTQITEIKTTYNETPFWKIATPLILAYAVWELLKFWKAYKVAQINAGSTIRNLIGLKDKP